MNRSALIVMFLIVVAAGVFAWFQGRGEETAERVRSPLEEIDYSSVATITAKREGQAAWTLEKRGSSLALRSEAVAGGAAVAGDPKLRARILGFLQDAAWIEQRDERDLDLVEWGLAPAMITVEIVDATGRHRFEVGKPDLAKDVFLRDPDRRRVFRYPARALEDLGLEPRWYRDPRLADLPAQLVERIELAPRDAEPWALERVGARWYVKGSSGASFRADSDRALRMVVALANLEGRPTGRSGAETEPEALFRVTVTGNGRACSYLVLDCSPEAILARRAEEPDPRLVDGALARYFVADPGELEDRRLFGVEMAELEGITIRRPGRDELRLGRNGDYWRLLLGDLLVRPVDPEAFRGFRERFESLLSAGREALPADFRAEAEVELRFERDLAIPPLVVAFSAPDERGRRLARRSDSRDGLVVTADLRDLIEIDYWELMARFFGSAGSDRIEEFTIRDPEGTTYRAAFDGEAGRWNLVAASRAGTPIPGFERRALPAETVRVLLDRLAQLSVSRYLGERSDAELERIFAEPRYVVTWKSPEMLIVPPTGPRSPCQVEEKRLEVGTRLDDDHLQARLNLHPALVFPVAGTDLLPVTDLLRVMKD